MYLQIKKLVPRFIKSCFWQNYLNNKFSKDNFIGKRVFFSKDAIIGKKCKISNNVTLGRSVKLANNIFIGNGTFLENIDISDYSLIDKNVTCTGYGPGKIQIGQNTYIGISNVLDWSENIIIGNYVHIAGPSTGLWTHTSAPMCLNSIPLAQKNIKFRPTAPITIQDNVYIGGNCTIYPGITIGHHSIVAPNSAVTKNVEPYSMVGGVPAKVIKILKQNH